MKEELNLQRIDYEEMLINHFTILLISLHRIALQRPRKKNLQNMNDMEQATQYFRMHYNKPISIEDYAVSHNISISEYYGAAEPPVRCGESHLSGLTEPPQFVY